MPKNKQLEKIKICVQLEGKKKPENQQNNWGKIGQNMWGTLIHWVIFPSDYH